MWAVTEIFSEGMKSMERQLERKREAEPVRRSQAIERWWQRLEEGRKQAQTLPRVVKFADRPWVQNAQTFVKNYTGRTGLAGRLTRLPINNFDLNEQIIAPGSKSGKHRHYTEALFFVIEGEYPVESLHRVRGALASLKVGFASGFAACGCPCCSCISSALRSRAASNRFLPSSV